MWLHGNECSLGIDETREFWLTPHPILEAIFRAFEQEGTRWCLLRPLSDSGNPSGDVDVLIDPEGVGRLRRILQKLEFVQIPGWGPGLHFLSYHLPTDQWLWLHIVTELSFGPDYAIQSQAAETCLVRRQHDGVTVVLAPDDAFWSLLLHCMLDKGAIAARHRARLQDLVGMARMDGPLAQVVEQACPTDWTPARMVECVRQGDWTTLERLAPSLLATWRHKRPVGARQILVHRGRQMINRLVKLWCCRGLSVALLGPDGAGKSTLAVGIQNSFIFPVSRVYMGLTGGLLPYVDRLRVPGVVLSGRLLIFWCRYLIAQYHKARGRLVVFDRYIYDATVPHPERLNWLRRISRWIDGHACPGPDLVLVLNAPGEVMYKRKGEYNPEMLENWRQHFLALQHHTANVEIVDTTRAEETVRANVIDLIWQRYVVRWRKN